MSNSADENSSGDLGEEFIDGLEAQFGDFPKTRAIHAKGIGLTGVFTANGEAAAHTAAAHLRSGKTPVIARFSNGDGNPSASDGAAFSRGFAVGFDCSAAPAGRVDLLSIVSPTFITSKPEIFLEFIRALKPDPKSGQPKALAFAEFALRHGRTMSHVIKQQRGTVPASFATTGWHAVHAFKLTADGGQISHGRFSWVPSAGVNTLERSEAQKLDPNFLVTDAHERVAGGTLEFDLELTIAGKGDPLDRPDEEWSSEAKVTVGHLSLDALANVEASSAWCFSPANLVGGIEPPSDEIFPARLAAYAVSQSRRKE